MKSLKIIIICLFLFFVLFLGFQSYAIAESSYISVVPQTLKTKESGSPATFTVRIRKGGRSTFPVTITVISNNMGEGNVSPTSFTIPWSNRSTPVLVSVSVYPVDDSVADGDQPYSITIQGTSEKGSLNPVQVMVTNQDNDIPPPPKHIIVTPTSGLTTTEGGGQDIFSVYLTSEPTADVTIGLSSSDTTEGRVAPARITFTPANWSNPQTVTVTVTGVNDNIIDGPIAYTIITSAAVSNDTTGYNGFNPADVSVTNNDNNTAGVTVTPTSGLKTTEAGGTDTFTVRLNRPPTANVAIALSSSDTTEGRVAPASITFTRANWSNPQIVTVTGVNDNIIDGSIAYTVITAAAVSNDTTGYNGLNPPDVSVTNIDNDAIGITVTPTSEVITTEAGEEDYFIVYLNSEPTADVTIGLKSSDTAEGTVSPASLTFTPDNWSTAQTITVTGIDDHRADGPIAYTIITSAAVSADTTGYSDLNPDDVSVTNNDNDAAGVTVNPTSGLITTEAGGTDTFTVVLNSQPTADVAIGLSSSDSTEGTVTPVRISFNATHPWNVAQTVTVTGVNDNIIDGPKAYTIVTSAAVSNDTTGYSGLNPADVSVTNNDNDTAGITVTQTSGLITTEARGTATFTVVLNSQPTADVTIALSSSDTTEGTVAPASLTFTPANWSTARPVTATGVDDNIKDGPIAYTIVTAAAVSNDTTGYSSINPANVSVTNTDNDTAGVTVTPTSGLTTTEAGGTATFTVRLNSEPTANVIIALSSSDTTEGAVSPSSLTFTSANWSTARSVTVTGVDDNVDDGNVAYTIVTSTAVSNDTTGYSSLNPADVSVTNTDNDTAGITVTPTSGLTTTEARGTATFTVVLNSQPTADVIIALSSSDTTEGTVAPASITFTPANWSTARPVTATGVDDNIKDGSIAYTIITAAAVSNDTTGYNGFNPADVSVTNIDNNAAGITVTSTSGLKTTEAGGTDTFTVRLNRPPTANVTIALSSSDTTEGTVAPASLTFTSANWSTARSVTVTGVDDNVDDGNVAYTIVTSTAVSNDTTGYSSLNPADVSVTNTDNDTAGVTVTPTSGLITTEARGTVTFTVRLNSQPTADVIIALSSSDTTEGTVAPASLTFTSTNWSTARPVTVTGVDDNIKDGSIAYTIVTAAAVSNDTTGYNGLNPADVSVTNTDNDTAGVTVTPTSGLITTEARGTATFTIVLNSQPTANVIIALSSSDTTEGTVAPASITFTSTNWSTARSVTVTGVNDNIIDGSIAYTIITAAAVSNDTTGYSGLNPANVSVTNIDNNAAGVKVTSTSGLKTTEAGSKTTFTVRLNRPPTANVIIALSSSDTTEGAVSPSSLTFTPATWSNPQTVTVTGINDYRADGPIAYTIITAAAVSSDTTGYNGFNPVDVSVTNTDNDKVTVPVLDKWGKIALFLLLLVSLVLVGVKKRRELV